MSEPVQNSTSSLPQRILRFPLSLILIEGLALVLIVSAVSYLISRNVPHNTVLEALGALTLAMLVFAVYRGCRRWLERGTTDELALAGSGRELGLGLITGFCLFSASTAIVALMGGVSFEGLRGFGQFWSMLSMAIISGSFEETLFRGIILRQLERLVGSWGALAITSLLFGAAHLANPHASWIAAAAIALEAGVMLGAAFLLTRRLWLAIGIHAAWNFTQGWVYSIPVSGSKPPLGLLISRIHGPDWLTGGAFGLEASAVAVIVVTLFGAVLLWIAVRRGRIQPPMWRRGAI